MLTQSLKSSLESTAQPLMRESLLYKKFLLNDWKITSPPPKLLLVKQFKYGIKPSHTLPKIQGKANNTISKWWNDYLVGIILWKPHQKWEVDCGQHMEVKCLPITNWKMEKSSRSSEGREENKVGKFRMKFIMTVPYWCWSKFV